MEDMNIRELGEAIEKSEGFRGTVSYNEPLAERTTMKVGGPALIFVEPEDVLSLASALVVLKGVKAPVFVLGGGSSLFSSPAFTAQKNAAPKEAAGETDFTGRQQELRRHRPFLRRRLPQW